MENSLKEYQMTDGILRICSMSYIFMSKTIEFISLPLTDTRQRISGTMRNGKMNAAERCYISINV